MSDNRLARCRVIDRHHNPCPSPALDESWAVPLCIRHAAGMIADLGTLPGVAITLTGPVTLTGPAVPIPGSDSTITDTLIITPEGEHHV